MTKQPTHEELLTTFGTQLNGVQIRVTETGAIDFFIGNVPVMAYVKDGATRIRGSIFLDPDANAAEADAWVARQRPPASGVLEAVERPGNRDTVLLRILFERPLVGHSAHLDPLYNDALDYAEAWSDRSDVEERSGSDRLDVPGDPRNISPANAWLLMGDDASFLTQEDLAEDAPLSRGGVFETLWTCAKQTEVGDLVLLYFIAPRKAVHFVARATSRAFFDRTQGVNAIGEVRDEQWWTYLTVPIEIEPIAFADLRHHAGGHLLLRGRSGHYLRPETITALPVRAKYTHDQAALSRILQTPVGQANLPDPATMTMDQWPHLASGAMRIEADVSRYLVEPLLRHALEGTTLTWASEYRVGRGFADYVILDGDRPRCVIEVKLAIQERADHVWANCNDFRQTLRYAAALDCPAILMDANRVLLIDRGADKPAQGIQRRSAGHDQVETIVRHVAGR